MKSALTACMVCLVCLSSFVVSVAVAQDVTLDPAAITGTLTAGESQNAQITITLPESVPRGDVVFAIDTTGAMGLVLDALRDQGNQIMAEINSKIEDSRFGVVSFMDYPQSYTGFEGYICKAGEVVVPCVYGIPKSSDYRGDYAYRVDQDLTPDPAQVSAALNRLYDGDGADFPEDYTRVIYESQFLPWRTNAKKILVVFGDAYPHAAPSGRDLMAPWDQSTKLFTSLDAPYGGDPGRDEVAGTADDLDYATEIQKVADNHIAIVGIYCPYQASNEINDAANNFRYMAYVTGGFYVRSSSTNPSSEIASQIVTNIQEMAKQDIKEMSLRVREPDYAGWVTLPGPYTDVPWPSVNTFSTAITPPAGTPDGTYSFTIDVTGDGIVLGSVPVTITVSNGKVVLPLSVSLDIKPGSCPNSFNPKEKGVLPAAILGSRNLKVTDIDPKSILLTREGGTAGVKPLRSSLEDVASPSEKTCSCGVQSGKEDRKKDLTLKFDSQEVVKTLGIKKDDGCIRVTITGVLKSSDPAVDGRPFTGSDSLRVLNTGQGSCDGKDRCSCDGKDGNKDTCSCDGKDGKDDKGSCDHGKDGDSHGDGGCDQDRSGQDSGDHQDGKDGVSHGDNGNGQDKGGSDSGDNRDGKDSSGNRGRN
jgi:hypothetical protein